MANTAVVATRRGDIAARWLKGQAVAAIARELDTPLGTVKHDLVYIRRELLQTQGDVVRLTRARTMAVLELVAAHAWQRVDVLTRQAEPDEHALGAYLALVARTQGQIAKLAGLGGKPTWQVEHEVLNRDLSTWVDEHDPNAQQRKAWRAELAAGDEDGDNEDEDGEADEDEDDGSVSEAELIQQVGDAYERGLTDGRAEAHTVAMAAIREVAATVAEQVQAEAAAEALLVDSTKTDEQAGTPQETPTPDAWQWDSDLPPMPPEAPTQA